MGGFAAKAYRTVSLWIAKFAPETLVALIQPKQPGGIATHPLLSHLVLEL